MKPSFRGFLVESSRFILSTVFLFSGVIKAIDPVGAGLKMAEYLHTFQMPVDSFWSMILGISMAAFEFSIGALLLMGIWRKWTAWITFVTMLFMTSLTLYLALYNSISDCGCFGEAVKLTNWESFYKNIFLILLSYNFLANGRKVVSAFSCSKGVVAFVVAIGGFLFFAYMNYRHLPMLDFRPYKVGSSLAELILTPDGAPSDEYTYEFVYERNGERRSFDMDNLPDETWTYVDRYEKLVSKGYTPPITDFSLFVGSSDVTEEIIETPGMMIWILTPNWEEVSKSLAPTLNTLYSVAQSQGILLYGISSSTKSEEGRWRNSTGTEYPLLFLDATTVKTIARAVPSVLFIKDGVIIAKMNARDLERREEPLREQVDNIYTLGERREPYLLRLLPLFVWFIYTIVSLILSTKKPYLPSSINNQRQMNLDEI
ncbi:BT_3928 family protein [Porphyromonas circumdentaria]|uniref:BT_3928 family protein n=1 Tax=Porphyromonas circumdentaria TaxID=29524 RepID=UPI0026DBB95D|nr:BT_3928 family protein [Porphyromonas circumdentaria]MDO4722796.1 DoxX family protein [Porphyromonas circumdentaria]